MPVTPPFQAEKPPDSKPSVKMTFGAAMVMFADTAAL
jgi:hypothetical protein